MAASHGSNSRNGLKIIKKLNSVTSMTSGQDTDQDYSTQLPAHSRQRVEQSTDVHGSIDRQ